MGPITILLCGHSKQSSREIFSAVHWQGTLTLSLRVALRLLDFSVETANYRASDTGLRVAILSALV